ncbi:MAG: hypothetical protein ACXADF_18005 [Candidatus Thorarchaeota archaeon]|jgi:hypothetical protein
MGDSLSRLRAAIRRQQSSRSHQAVRYPSDLRQRVIDYVRAGRSRGESNQSLANDLGLALNTVRRWSADRSGRFERVRIVEKDGGAPGERLVLITRSGHRVEGLGLSSLATLLERLS